MLPERVSKLLTAYVDGELTSRQRRTVVRLLQRSPEARRLFKKLKGDSMILRGLPRRKLNMDLSGSVLLTINARNIQLRPEACPPVPRPPRRSMKKWLALVSLAVVVLLAVGTASYLFFGGASGRSGVETTGTSPTRRLADRPAIPTSPIAVIHDADPLQTTPPTSAGRPQRSPQELAGMLQPSPQTYQTAAPRLVRILPLRGLDLTQLQEDLKASKTFRFDLLSSDPAAQAERVLAALKSAGLTVRIEPAAQAGLGKRARQNYSIYTEELTPEELSRVWLLLAVEENKKPLGDRLVVNALTGSDVARVLGGEPGLYPPPPAHQGPGGVDLSKDITEGTLKDLEKIPSAGSPRASLERLAMVVTYTPLKNDEPRTPTSDVQAFIDSRRGTYRQGATQVLITVWNQPGL